MAVQSTCMWYCPHCGQSIRASKKARILCQDCLIRMLPVGTHSEYIGVRDDRKEGVKNDD